VDVPALFAPKSENLGGELSAHARVKSGGYNTATDIGNLLLFSRRSV
jgi:hypothetical protein